MAQVPAPGRSGPPLRGPTAASLALGLKHLNLGRLGAALGLLVLVALAVGLISLLTLHGAMRRQKQLLEQQVANLVETQRLLSSSERRARYVREYLLTATPEAAEQLQAARQEFREQLQRVSSQMSSPDTQELLTRIQSEAQAVKSAVDELIHLRRQMRGLAEEELIRQMDLILHPPRERLDEHLASLVQLQENALSLAALESSSSQARTSLWLAGMLASTGLLTVLLGAFLLRALRALASSEARFRNMADCAPAVVWVTDADGQCNYLNRFWYEFTGQPPQQSLGFGWLEAIHLEDRDTARAVFLEANARQQPFRVDYRLRRYDGEYRWTIDSAAPRFGTKGEFLGYVGSMLDITERKQAEQEREQLLEELREAVRLRDDFLTVASHELKTPLTSLQLQLQLLRAGLAKAPLDGVRSLLEPRLERTLWQTGRLGLLVNNLLDVTRIRTGRLELQLEPVDLAEVSRDVVERLSAEAQRAGSELRLEVSGSLVGRWDRMRLEQVLTNLVSNAIKYGAGQPVEVQLRECAGRALLCVRDRGIGISPEEQERIFGRFARAVSSRHYGGLGLGLYITQQIIEALGGCIRVESWPGRGSTFTVELPCEPWAEQAPEARA